MDEPAKVNIQTVDLINLYLIMQLTMPHRQFSQLFVLISAFMMLSLFIGAVCNGMNEACEQLAEEKVRPVRSLFDYQETVCLRCLKTNERQIPGTKDLRE